MNVKAQSYHKHSEAQFDLNCQFIRDLDLRPGDKVLDMGCGTGRTTKFIADIVGCHGQVVGVDPDVERIKLAKKNYEKVDNIQFHVGSSVTGFPRDNEAYYDVHVSTAVFHWLPAEEKPIYIEKAHQCLKPGGKLGIISAAEKGIELGKIFAKCHSLTEEGYRELFHKSGLFPDTTVTTRDGAFRFQSLQEFKTWFNASCYNEYSECPASFKEFLTQHEDGKVSLNIIYAQIKAMKN